MKIAAFAIAATLLSGPTLAADDVDILGIQMGAPLTLPAGQRPDPPGVPALGAVTWAVHMRLDRLPPFVKYTDIYAETIDGNVEGVTIFTKGDDVQDATLRQLREKFGVPASIETKEKQTRGGATFHSYDAVWKIGTTAIHFEGISSNLDTGTIHVETAKMFAKQVEQGEAMHRNEPHL